MKKSFEKEFFCVRALNSQKIYAKMEWEHCKFQPAVTLRILVRFKKFKIFWNQNDEISLLMKFHGFCTG